MKKIGCQLTKFFFKGRQLSDEQLLKGVTVYSGIAFVIVFMINAVLSIVEKTPLFDWNLVFSLIIFVAVSLAFFIHKM